MSKRKLLVIDDEPGVRSLFRYIMEPEGFEVTEAVDGVEGMKAFRGGDFDIVFLDVHMPKKNGAVVFYEMRKLKPHQPVVVFSSSHDPNIKFEEEMAKEHAVFCFFKPVEIGEIMDAVKKALEA